MTQIDTSTEAVEALLNGVLPGPWAYRPQKFDDWGYVRAPDVGDGWMPFICQAKSPSTEGEEDEARRNGTDPWGANAIFIAASRELVPALLAERDALRAEVDKAVLWAKEQHSCADKYAARIEELESKLSLRTNLHEECIYLLKSTEAKLEKAVDALDRALRLNTILPCTGALPHTINTS